MFLVFSTGTSRPNSKTLRIQPVAMMSTTQTLCSQTTESVEPNDGSERNVNVRRFDRRLAANDVRKTVAQCNNGKMATNQQDILGSKDKSVLRKAWMDERCRIVSRSI